MNLPLVSIIIVNYRSTEMIGRLLDSLEKTVLRPEEYEVIVSNNDPNEQTGLDVLAGKYGFRILHHAKNLGFGAANNRAAVIARGEYLFFCNPDTEFVSGDIREALRLFKVYSERIRPISQGSSLGVIGFRLVDVYGHVEPWSVGPDVSLWEIIRNNLGWPPGKKFWQSPKTVEVGRVSGAALMTPHAIFDTIGGFDERFFLYFEDADLCRRARQTSHRVIYHPKVTFRHQNGASMVSSTEQKKHYFDSQSHYFRKHRPGWETHMLRWIIKLST